jgi:catechol 2,3-dioxygenase-like lactoylglutathione lyase family enzyme
MYKLSMVGLSVLIITGCSWFSSPPSRANNPVVTGVNFVGMTVTDIEQSTVLYQNATSVQVVHEDRLIKDPLLEKLTGRESASLTTRLMRGVNAQVMFMQFDNPSAAALNAPTINANGPGIAHFAFQAVDNTQTYQKFLSGGAKHIGSHKMMTNPRTHVSYAYVRDNDDTIVEIEHVDIEALALPEPPKNEIRMRHISLATGNMERAIDFYSALLETKNPRRSGYLFNNKGEFIDNVSGLPESEVEFAWFQVRNLELEIIQYHNPKPKEQKGNRPIDASGFNMIVFNVSDLDDAKSMLLEAGGTLEIDSGEFDGEQIFFGRDPDGNLLGFQSLDANSPFSAKNFKDNGLG